MIIIRKAVESDAQEIVSYLNELFQEDDLCLITTKEDFNISVEDERKFIIQNNTSENSLFLIAENNKEIIGIVTCNGFKNKTLKHMTILGMSIKNKYRNKGIGNKMLSEVLSWARTNTNIKRIELNVFERNTPAINLYKKFGFELEGVRKNSIYKNNRYENDLIMAFYL